MIRQILPLLFRCTLAFLLLVLFSPSQIKAQSGGLGELSDMVNNLTLGALASHSINFSLPVNAAPIRTSDYIIIYMPGFYNPTAASSITGTFGGVPVYSVSGNYVKITGVMVTPGAQISINGITAINPNLAESFQVMVLISEDAEGKIIKNIGQTMSQITKGNVSITASIITPEARLIISGLTGKNNFVTFTEYDSVTGTVVAAPTGYFSKVFSGVIPGTHEITFYATDMNNLTTTPITLNLYAPAFQETTVTDQILSPTIQINHNQYSPGDPIIATGSAVPDGAITLFTEAPLRSYNTTTNANGDWTYTINNTSQYVLGDYHIHAIVQSDTGLVSLNSPSIGFSITNTSATPSGTACGNISRGDLNCDTEIDLTDFSILMYYWGTNNKTADINQDSLVSLTDFSIMMYWWGS